LAIAALVTLAAFVLVRERMAEPSHAPPSLGARSGESP
jgi:hypothetical protein